ncbi:flavin reductase [Gluconacetobacter entanii]|uniref:Flavin reductase n=1 Tax=Gluconacetobacter entanii TaxID=108528 RepID=A0ABT3K339_9PROT|nr:flavin reductase [Gluconacetobacter entanii]MBE7620984.1 flavin reductase [Komagataeibacter sp. FXV2]MCW4589812.1 flavin reductase [Gluconacetobacter entanii]MCW4594394.1 flavin reductase [Gluconacetobacter entanii]NPC88218.1 flavin reductase [Gluconacetobacter entanii]
MDTPFAKDTPVSKTEFRNAMARVCAPVNVITTRGPAGRGGFTATAMCSVTDEPPMLLVCMNSMSAQCDLFLKNGRFCVNVLSHDHRDLAGHFAGRTSDMEARYAHAQWEDMPSGNQALHDAMVSFDCVLADSRRAGTHYILIGEVVGIRVRPDGNALLYFDRDYVHVPTRIGSFGG